MTVVQFPISFNVKAGVVLPWNHYVMEFRTAMIFQMKSYAVSFRHSSTLPVYHISKILAREKISVFFIKIGIKF